MTQLQPEQERMITEFMQEGGFHTPLEVIDAALGALRRTLHPDAESTDEALRRKRAAEAADSIRKNRVGNRLDGLKIRDLINEGRA